MKSITILLLCFWIEGTLTEYQHYYVKSDTSDPCPHNLPCETLDVYVSNESAYFTDNTCFIFLPGTHTLNSTVSIHNVTNVALVGNADLNEGNVTIQCNGSGGLVFQHASRVKLVNLSFVSCGQPLPDSLQRDGETAQAALAFGEVSDLLLDSVSVSHSTGYGVLGHCVHGNFEIVYCLFDSNKGNTQHLGGNAAIEYINCSQTGHTKFLLLSSSNFTNGYYDPSCGNSSDEYYTRTLATGLVLILSQANTTVSIRNVIMKGNDNSHGFGANLFIHFFKNTANTVTIQDSMFLHGISTTGGGISVSFLTEELQHTSPRDNTLTIQNSHISYNKGILGSGLYLHFRSENMSLNKLNVINCTFQSNTQLVSAYKLKSNYLGNGVAVHIVITSTYNRLVQLVHRHLDVVFNNCTFNASYALMNRQDSHTQLTVLGINFVIANGEVTIKNCQFINSGFTALGAYRSKIRFHGNILIQNNTGINGGGLTLCESSYIILTNNVNINFVNNHAFQSGGGIFIEKACLHSKPFCSFQLDDFKSCLEISKVAKITMINNTAGYAGDHIYGGSFDSCKINNCNSSELFKSLFIITPNKTNSAPSAVTSDPQRICFCTDGVNIECQMQTMHYPTTVFPGDNISFSAVIVGQFEGTVPGAILLHSQLLHLHQEILPTEQSCSPLSVTLTTRNTENSIVELFIFSDVISNNGSLLSISTPRYVNISLKTCPPGFSHSNGGTCECEKKLRHNQVTCDITSHTIHRIPPAWIGYYNNTDGDIHRGIIYQKVCPYDYCNSEKINITSDDTMFDQDSQCAPNRTGILCSQCQDGFTLSMGTSECMQCNDKVALPFYIIFFLFNGIIVVVLLAVFDITSSNGLLSTLLFYANVVNLNGSLFLPFNNKNVLTAMISWLNLSPGYKLCLYSNTGTNTKVWLNFCFPVYLFLIAAAIVVLCRKSKRFAKIFGGNITRVLATIFLMSYTKLIQSVVTVLSLTIIEYPSNTTSIGRVRKLVWLSDPSQEYFSGKHIPLALVAIVFGLLILAYTLVLLFVQPLQRYSHLRCFSWMAKLKPLIDAYTAPHIIKDNCRYWEGLLLLFRLILATIFALNEKGKVDTNLTAITSVCVILLVIAWSSGGVYKKTYLNIINSVSIFNLAALAIAAGYLNNNQHLTSLLKKDDFHIVSYTSMSVAVLIMCVMFIYHAYCTGKKWCTKCKRRNYQPLLSDVQDENLPPLRQFPVQD